ncbi:entericidin EcnA/B family protein [Allosediminivita pacifica]|uniref:Entericidin EcnA/B family protein n=1 Tax=Allosediminivita pacifica TaxID=1267769 RepID=A0A2T6AW77_9RHOB|nr:entericidin EcnA/B family protein [Allosediminivita pacifica]PTX48006.1 hypothetical protein C8N44_1105 [Allosediminivita pacifica]
MKPIVILVGALTLLSACATIDGIGQDISAGARQVERMF